MCMAGVYTCALDMQHCAPHDGTHNLLQVAPMNEHDPHRPFQPENGVIGGCTALVGGALPNQDARAPVTTDTSPAGTPVNNGPTPDPVVTPTNEPVKPTVQPAPKVTHKPAPKLTASQEQAIGTAEDYL